MQKEKLYGCYPPQISETSVITGDNFSSGQNTVDYNQAFGIWCRLRDQYGLRQRYVDLLSEDQTSTIERRYSELYDYLRQDFLRI